MITVPGPTREVVRRHIGALARSAIATASWSSGAFGGLDGFSHFGIGMVNVVALALPRRDRNEMLPTSSG
jgi:hypothetical protein